MQPHKLFDHFMLSLSYLIFNEAKEFFVFGWWKIALKKKVLETNAFLYRRYASIFFFLRLFLMEITTIPLNCSTTHIADPSRILLPAALIIPRKFPLVQRLLWTLSFQTDGKFNETDEAFNFGAQASQLVAIWLEFLCFQWGACSTVARSARVCTRSMVRPPSTGANQEFRPSANVTRD